MTSPWPWCAAASSRLSPSGVWLLGSSPLATRACRIARKGGGWLIGEPDDDAERTRECPVNALQQRPGLALQNSPATQAQAPLTPTAAACPFWMASCTGVAPAGFFTSGLAPPAMSAAQAAAWPASAAMSSGVTRLGVTLSAAAPPASSAVHASPCPAAAARCCGGSWRREAEQKNGRGEDGLCARAV